MIFTHNARTGGRTSTGRPSRSRGGWRRGARAVAAASAILGLAFSGVLTLPATSAQAADYPSWQELQDAKSNTSAAATAVANIQALIAQLEVQVAETQAAAQARGAELQIAQDKYDEANQRADALEAQALESQTKADTATTQAGQLAAQLYRSGGGDLSMNLMLEASPSDGTADELLSKLGSMSKLVERSTEVYEQAQTARNTAASLGDQAEIAKGEREKLRIAAEEALIAAQEAQAAAENALTEQQAQSIVLDQQLKFMQDTEATTATAYEAGVAERARLEAERIARENANRPSGGGGGGGGPGAGLGGGYINNGWAVPAGGRITDVFGPRQVICGSDGCSGGTHYATDIGTGCGASIYAAAAGTVVYAGWYGTYGNFVLIDHGNGVETGYAHIRPGGIWVGYGQYVDAGQNIASSGTTGASTGCHLHFEVRTWGNRIDPQPWMADRGVPLG